MLERTVAHAVADGPDTAPGDSVGRALLPCAAEMDPGRLRELQFIA